MPTPDNLSRGDLGKIWKAIRDLRHATPLNKASIGRGGLRVHSGGVITIENGGLKVTGTAEIIGKLIASGTIEFNGPVKITGPLDISGLTQIMGDLRVLTGGKITAGSITLNPDGSAKFGTMTIDPTGKITSGSATINPDGSAKFGTMTVDPTGKITSGLFVLNPDGSAKFGDLLIGADGTITTGVTVIDTTGRAEFGSFIIDPASTKLIEAPGGYLFSNGPDSVGLASSGTSSVALGTLFAELNFGGTGGVTSVVRAEQGLINLNAPQTSVNGNLVVTGLSNLNGNMYSHATANFTGPIIHSAITNNSNAGNLYVDANGRYWRSSSASRYKLDQQLMTLPDSLLDPVMKDWIDAGSQVRFDALNNEPRPFREHDQMEYDSINLRRVPGMVAEDVAAAGGEAFVTYDSDGQVEGFAYDRFALARTQILAEQLAAERVRNDALEARLKALEDRLPA